MDDFWRWFLDTVIYGFFSKWFTYNDRRVVDGGVDAVAFSCSGAAGSCHCCRPLSCSTTCCSWSWSWRASGSIS